MAATRGRMPDMGDGMKAPLARPAAGVLRGLVVIIDGRVRRRVASTRSAGMP